MSDIGITAELSGFVPDLAFIPELRTSPAMIQALAAFTERAYLAAVQSAPVGDPSDPAYSATHRPGGYRRGMAARVFVTRNYPGIGPTAVGEVFNRNFKGAWIEYGTVNMAPQQIIHKAVEASAIGDGFTAI